MPVETAPGADKVEVPRANSRWHPVAKRWFDSLAGSGQSVFYQPSDWAMAYVVAESMSREFREQPIGVTKEGKPIMVALPPKGASLTAWLRAATVLMATEGDRRRLRLELSLPAASGEAEADVSELAQYRNRLQSS